MRRNHNMLAVTAIIAAKSRSFHYKFAVPPKLILKSNESRSAMITFANVVEISSRCLMLESLLYAWFWWIHFIKWNKKSNFKIMFSGCNLCEYCYNIFIIEIVHFWLIKLLNQITATACHCNQEKNFSLINSLNHIAISRNCLSSLREIKEDRSHSKP